MKKHRSFLALLIAFLALAGAILSAPTPAYAHAIVVRTDPSDGAVLGGPLRQIRLWFSEPIALGFTSFELVDNAGRHIAIVAHSDAASAALAVRNQGAGAAEVVLELPALSPSVYRLSWTVLSNTDLHNTTGSIVFGVQRATTGATAAAAEPLPSPIELALRWLNFSALACLVGALALALLVFPRATTADRGSGDEQIGEQTDWGIISTQLRARLLRLASWSAVLAMLAGLGLLIAQAEVAGAITGQNLFASAWFLVGGTSYSLAWLLRPIFLMILVAMLALAAGKYALLLNLRSPISIVLVLAIIIAQALQGHATAFAALSPLRVAADALHILAAGIWVGGLLALSLTVTPLLRAGPEQLALAWAILRRFGALAAGSLAALLVTGLFMGGQQVASLDALLTTLYGRALLLKIGLVAAVALIGLRNAASLHPGVAAALRWLAAARAPMASHTAMGEGRRGVGVRTSVARRVRLEAIGAAAVLLLAACLTAAQPARGPAFDPPVAETPAVAMVHANDLVVTLALKPNRPGQNFVTLGVFDTRRPAPAPIGEVAVQFQAPGASRISRVVASPLGKGRYEAADNSISGAGDMTIAVTIRRAGLPDAKATLPWTVLPAPRQPRVVLVSNQPLAPWANAAALVTALLLMLALAGLRLRRRMLSRATSFKAIISGVIGRRLRPLRKD